MTNNISGTTAHYFSDETNYSSILEENNIGKIKLECEEKNKTNEERSFLLDIPSQVQENIYTLLRKYPQSMIEKDGRLAVTIKEDEVKDNNAIFLVSGKFDKEGNLTKRAYGISISRTKEQKKGSTTNRGDNL